MYRLTPGTFADFTMRYRCKHTTNPTQVGGYYYEVFKRNLSFFGSLNYDYQDTYLASFTARRDGSTAFGKDDKFANFYAGSLGWVVSKESFFNVRLSIFKDQG
jgi:hypothetical protein